MAFGMQVLAYDPFLTDARAESLGVRKATVDEIVTQADFITVHTPLMKETKYLIAEREFAMMKKGVRVLNCARGGIIKEEALVAALKEGKVAGAALDVYEEEPLREGHPFREFKNVVLTPHLGASTKEAQVNVAIDVAEEVAKFLRNEPFKNAVNLPSLPAERMQQVQPYLELGEKLGKLAAQLLEGNVSRLRVTYGGEVAALEVGPITRTILKGFLAYHHGDEVNYVNAPFIAEQNGILVEETKTSKAKVFTNLITLEVEADGVSKTVTGTLYNGFGPRIVQINGYAVDAVPEGQMLITRHVDIPGIIGRIGTILGNDGVNIATMQVGRKEAGGTALMVMGVDGRVSEQALQEIAGLEPIQAVYLVEL